jgi:formate dehydrogenase iron-sulfur subunit
MRISVLNVRIGFGTLVLAAIACLGISLALYRFVAGIGAVSNLNQGYPWGFWIGADVLAGIALAAGGFVVAGVMHMFGGEKYHPLVRPTILTAFLGYLLFIVALMVDLGRPWTIWHMVIYWHHESPMFEVGWCVMMYTMILFMEFLPVVFERFELTRAHAIWTNALGRNHPARAVHAFAMTRRWVLARGVLVGFSRGSGSSSSTATPACRPCC